MSHHDSRAHITFSYRHSPSANCSSFLLFGAVARKKGAKAQLWIYYICAVAVHLAGTIFSSTHVDTTAFIKS